MGEEEEQLWYYMVEGEQVGPVTAEELQQLAMNGTVHAETQMWTEGLDQWIPATNVEGLLPAGGVAPQAVPVEPAPEPGKPRLITGAAAQAAHPLAGEMVAPAAQQPQFVQTPQPLAAQPVAAQPMATQPGMMQPGVAQPGAAQPMGLQPGMGMMGPVPPGSEYPPTGTKRASYGLLIGMLIGTFVIGLGGMAGGLAIGNQSKDMEVTGGLIMMGSYGLMMAFSLITAILSYMYLYRAWNCLRFGGPRTTAGKAVGFLFIPVFSVYWVFVAIYGLAQDWNRITASYPNIQGAPRMGEGMFLTFLICMISGIGIPVGLVLWFIVWKQICDGINFFAGQNLRQQPRGMSFY